MQALESSAGDAPADRARSGARIRSRDNVLLGLALAALSASFYYGWFRDPSHGIGGAGWADQTLYTQAAKRLFAGHLPTVRQLHFAPSYPLLGAAGSIFSRNDPFWIVSYALLMGSAIFLYRAARTMLSEGFALLFLLTLFVWDGRARSFNSASELFAVPWNNQLLFFAFAFFLWAYTAPRRTRIDPRIVLAMGGVVGVVATAREESILFTVPLAAIYLAHRRARAGVWVLCGIAATLAALPGLLIKIVVLGTPFSSGRADSYGTVSDKYLSLGRLGTNLLDTIVDSGHAGVDARRRALLQAAPWLWLAPPGVMLLLLRRRYEALVKAFVVVSLALMAFYLSGTNMSAAKLRFHCLRYVSPAFIVLSLGAVVTVSELWELARTRAGRPPAERPLK